MVEIKENSALIIVDVQNDFCFPGRALSIEEGEKVIPIINELIGKFTTESGGKERIFASRDWHPRHSKHFDKWPQHCIAGTNGSAFPISLKLPAGTMVISKGQSDKDDGYSAFEGVSPQGLSLSDELKKRGIKTIYVVGLATDYCVKATAISGRTEGFEVIVLTAGCRPVKAVDGQLAINEMAAAGVQVL